MGLVLMLMTALAITPVNSSGTIKPPLTMALEKATAPAAARCRTWGEPPRGHLGYVFGTSDRAIAELPPGEAVSCVAALWHPQASRGAIRLLRDHAPTPALGLDIATWLGLCNDAGDTCSVARCDRPDPKRELACLARLKGAASERMEARYLSAVAKVRQNGDAYATLIDARVAFARLTEAGFYPALADLAMIEYRLTNMSAAYDAAIRGAAYRLPAAEALAAFLKVEGYGSHWDLEGSYALATDAARGGAGEGDRILAMDLASRFGPDQWRMLQEAMVRHGLHAGPVDGPFRESWFDALEAYNSANGDPPGVTLATLHALGLLKPISHTVREPRQAAR